MERPPDELERFYAAQYVRVVSALTLYLGDLHTAEEIAQDAFVRVCRDWEKVRSMAAPGVWVHRVAMNLATSRFRRRAAERRANERAAVRPRSRRDDVDVTARVSVREALARIPRNERSALILRFYSGLSVRETATVLGRPEGTVKTWTSRGIASLRDAGLTEVEEVADGG